MIENSLDNWSRLVALGLLLTAFGVILLHLLSVEGWITPHFVRRDPWKGLLLTAFVVIPGKDYSSLRSS